MRNLGRLSLAAVAAAASLGWLATASRADVLVDMVPRARSGETNQDAEPTITVDPNRDRHLVGTAFTWDNLSAQPMVTSTAPVYVSTDGGSTWALSFIVPSQLGAGFPTGDITVDFSETPSTAKGFGSSWLYGGILSSQGFGRPVEVLRDADPTATTVMSVLDTRAGNVDQPHTAAQANGNLDQLFVGFNNGWGCLAPNGRSSTIDVSSDAARAAAPPFNLDVIESRNSACQDGYAQVPAPHADGTVYAAFIHDYNRSARLVVVRDDHWGQSNPPFAALKDPGDGNVGVLVTSTITMPFGSLGQNRLGASNVSIAVHPADSSRVYVAWGDGGFDTETIHVRLSLDRGATWSQDLVTISNAVNPEVAVNDDGVAGLLYQQVNGGSWQTFFSSTTDPGGTTFALPGLLLSSQTASSPAPTYEPYIGDYASLRRDGKDFIGMFSTSNFPDKANFMPGVKYQREVDWRRHKLFADRRHKKVVPPSIDPFFFRRVGNICEEFPKLCSFCASFPWDCYPIPNPWWMFECPECGEQILVDLGPDFERASLIDGDGREVGPIERLSEPVVLNGVRYDRAVTFQPVKGRTYALRCEQSRGLEGRRARRPVTVLRKTLRAK